MHDDEQKRVIVRGEHEVLAIESRAPRIAAAAPEIRDLEQRRERGKQHEHRVGAVARVAPATTCSSFCARGSWLKRSIRFFSGPPTDFDSSSHAEVEILVEDDEVPVAFLRFGLRADLGIFRGLGTRRR